MRQTARVWRRVRALCAACALGFGCEKADVQQGQRPRDIEFQKQYAAWAARQPRPPAIVVGRIEALLAREPCIGQLNHWSRSYAYDEDIRSQTLYPGIVDFHLKQAGRFGIQPGLYIAEPDSLITIDDTPIKMAWGDYEVSTGKLTIGFCGNNVGPAPESTAIDMQDYYDDLEVRRTKERERRAVKSAFHPFYHTQYCAFRSSCRP